MNDNNDILHFSLDGYISHGSFCSVSSILDSIPHHLNYYKINQYIQLLNEI
jgi:hypothetical protein